MYMFKKNKRKDKSNKKDHDLSFREQIKPIFIERYLEMLKSEVEYQKYENTILTPQRKSFRINKFKVKKNNDILKELNKKGIEIEKVPWCDDAYFVKFDKDNENQRSDLGNLFEHFLGQIYIQEATSMIPPLLLEIPDLSNLQSSNSFLVLDMASAPGSKTTQLADYMKDNGTLVANELDYKRIGALKINLERSSFTNVILTNEDGTKIEGNEIYDRILLDAPCSGSGVIRKSPKTIRTYNPKQLKSISKLQEKLLQRAFELLKKGGILTYSTCSLEPEENEFVIENFLKNNENAVLEKARVKNIVLNNKITEFNGIKISKEVTEKTMRIWPQDNDTNGFFVAKIKKK